MRHVNLSLMLLTTGTQPLIRFSLLSILDQISTNDRICVSINSADETLIKKTKETIKEIDHEGKVRVIVTGAKISVYEHYRFAIENSEFPHTTIVHDDEVYNSSLIDEIRKGFLSPDVRVVVGGMIQVDLFKDAIFPSLHHSFEESRVEKGFEWIKREEGLYPRFCFSTLALNKDHLDLNIFSPTSTAADCIAVTHQAVGGSIYQSKMVFATWLQLPTRNSRWYVIQPGLITPWKEFLDYFERIGDETLINKALKHKLMSLSVFMRMLFFVGIANRNILQISTCLTKIGEVNPLVEKSLSWLNSRIAITIFAPPCRLARNIKFIIGEWRARRNPRSIDPCRSLAIDESIWNDYIRAAMKLASTTS